MIRVCGGPLGECQSKRRFVSCVWSHLLCVHRRAFPRALPPVLCVVGRIAFHARGARVMLTDR